MNMAYISQSAVDVRAGSDPHIERCLHCGCHGHSGNYCPKKTKHWSVRCFHCGVLGHRAAQCSQKTIMCFSCNKPGHKQTSCTSPLRKCWNCAADDHISRECKKEEIGMCLNCFELGHKKWQCLKRRCYHCQGLGHYQANCPKSRKRNKRRKDNKPKKGADKRYRESLKYSRASEIESNAFGTTDSILRSTIAFCKFSPMYHPNFPGIYTWHQFQGTNYDYLPNVEHLHMSIELGFAEQKNGNYSGSNVSEHPTTLRRPARRARGPVNPEKDDMHRKEMKCNIYNLGAGSESSQSKTVGDSELENWDSAIYAKMMEVRIIQKQRSDKTSSWEAGKTVLVEEGGELYFGVVKDNPDEDNFRVEIRYN